MNNKVTDMIMEKKNNIEVKPINLSEENLISSEKSTISSDISDNDSDNDESYLII